MENQGRRSGKGGGGPNSTVVIVDHNLIALQLYYGKVASSKTFILFRMNIILPYYTR